jgi:hypothetical protein
LEEERDKIKRDFSREKRGKTVHEDRRQRAYIGRGRVSFVVEL